LVNHRGRCYRVRALDTIKVMTSAEISGCGLPSSVYCCGMQRAGFGVLRMARCCSRDIAQYLQSACDTYGAPTIRHACSGICVSVNHAALNHIINRNMVIGTCQALQPLRVDSTLHVLRALLRYRVESHDHGERTSVHVLLWPLFAIAARVAWPLVSVPVGRICDGVIKNSPMRRLSRPPDLVCRCRR
jgi:hypothetical protein